MVGGLQHGYDRARDPVSSFKNPSASKVFVMYLNVPRIQHVHFIKK